MQENHRPLRCLNSRFFPSSHRQFKPETPTVANQSEATSQLQSLCSAPKRQPTKLFRPSPNFPAESSNFHRNHSCNQSNPLGTSAPLPPNQKCQPASTNFLEHRSSFQQIRFNQAPNSSRTKPPASRLPSPKSSGPQPADGLRLLRPSQSRHHHNFSPHKRRKK
ncbi:hypothetical protein M758_UG259800 [Ceratodon purpureus]|nr:hypothetical protein M758_UG259800 [Ceratodon purpureus]